MPYGFLTFWMPSFQILAKSLLVKQVMDRIPYPQAFRRHDLPKENLTCIHKTTTRLSLQPMKRTKLCRLSPDN